MNRGRVLKEPVVLLILPRSIVAMCFGFLRIEMSSVFSVDEIFRKINTFDVQ